MKKRTIFILAVLLSLESTLFCWRFIIKPRGSKGLKEVVLENELLIKSIKQLEFEISDLEKEVDELSEFPWYREKIARKELQMGFPNEEIFLF